MKIELNSVTALLSSQDYLSYEKLLDEMNRWVEGGNIIEIEGSSQKLATLEDVDAFNRRMIQVHGIYGLI